MRTYLLIGLVVASGCWDELKPGRCDRSSDCPGGQYCNLEPTPQGNGRCADDGGLTHVDPVACSRAQDCPAATPVCVYSGVCFECETSADCTAVDRPICGPRFTCVGCTSDAECAAKDAASPGICMAHQNGRCASAAETIYVENTASCTDLGGTTTGTRGAPLCSLASGFVAITPTRRLVLVRGAVSGPTDPAQLRDGPVSIVGEQGAAVVDHGLVFQDTDLYVRGLTISGVPEAALAVTGGSLTARRLSISDNAGGGILIDGAACDIEDLLITENGPSSDLSWGGMRIQNAQAPRLSRVTLKANRAPGLSCTSQVQGAGIYAVDNAVGDIVPDCGIESCASPGPDCGAQLPQP